MMDDFSEKILVSFLGFGNSLPSIDPLCLEVAFISKEFIQLILDFIVWRRRIGRGSLKDLTQLLGLRGLTVE
jgi:hypothetical protein